MNDYLAIKEFNCEQDILAGKLLNESELAEERAMKQLEVPDKKPAVAVDESADFYGSMLSGKGSGKGGRGSGLEKG